MSAERHALEAVLDHSHALEKTIVELKESLRRQRSRNYDLERQLHQARAALDGHPDGPDEAGCKGQPETGGHFQRGRTFDLPGPCDEMPGPFEIGIQSAPQTTTRHHEETTTFHQE